MNGSIFEKFTLEKNLIYIAILAILVVFGFVFYLLFAQLAKNIRVIAPNGGEEWEIGQTYEITWRSRGIEKVGIVLFQGAEPKWIAEDVPASLGKYEWQIYPGQEYGSGFWIAVFEYPWQKGNEVDHSDTGFAITFPILASCDGLSILKEWTYLSNDLPDLRRVFITEESFSGNLDGFQGADQKCQQEAEKQGFDGKWQAFIGGDSDEDSAIQRLTRTPGGLSGVFVSAIPSLTLIRGDTCHRLLAKSFEEFLARFSGLVIINEEKLEQEFLENMENVWLGRLDEESKKNCTGIADVVSNPYKALAEKYSFTTTCQNWTRGEKYGGGYPVPSGEPEPLFPTCYTPAGKFTDAVALAGLASGLTGEGKDASFTSHQGKYCDVFQKLLCIEE